MTKSIKINTTLLIVFSVFQSIFGNQNSVFNIDKTNGLSHNSVTSVTQDNNGFLWVGTYFGINKIEGSNIKTFYNDNTQFVNEVVLFNNFVFATSNNGLSILNKETESFIENIPLDIASHKINAICKTNNNLLFVINGKNQIFEINEKLRIKEIPTPVSFKEKEKKISPHLTNENLLWIYSKYEILLYDIPTQKLSQLKSNLNNDINNLIHYSDNQFIVSSENKILFFNLENNIFNQSKSYTLPNKIVKIIHLRNNLYCIDIKGKAFKLDKNKNTFTSVNFDNLNVLTIFSDNESNIWIGSLNSGLHFTDDKQNEFEIIDVSGSLTAPQNNLITSLHMYNNELLIGFKQNGISSYNISTGISKKIANAASEVTSIINNEREAWFTTINNGLYRIDKQKNAVKQLNLAEYDSTIFIHTSLFYKDFLVLAYKELNNSLGLIFYDPSSNVSTKLKILTKNNLKDNEITSIKQDKNGSIWISTTQTGLIRFSPKNEIIDINNIQNNYTAKTFWYDNNYNEPSEYLIRNLYIDQTEILWLATQKGILKFNKIDKKEKLITFSKYNHYTNNIYSITEDYNDNLWLTSKEGLIKFNTRSEKHALINNADLPDNINFATSISFLIDSSILIPSDNRIVSFVPDKISFNKNIPKALILDIKVKNDSIAYLDKEKLSSNIIKIKSKSDITIYYNSTNNIFPHKNKFAYKLTGYDNNWTHANYYTSVTYNNLAPGKYEFKVCTANNNDIWSEETSITLQITKPFISWTTFFVFAILLLIALVGVIIYQVRLISSLKRNQSLLRTREHGIDEFYQLKHLIDYLPDFIYIKDRESRFVFGNKQLSKIMNAGNADKLIGKTDYDFYPKELAEQFFHDEQQLMEQDKPLLNKIEPGLFGGTEERWVSTTKIPIKDNKNRVIGIIGIGRDVTVQKEVEDKLIEQSESLKEINTILEEKQEEIRVQSEIIEVEKSQLRTLIDHLPDVIYFKDEKAQFITGNKALLDVMKAKSLQDIIGRTDYDFYKKDIADLYYEDDMNIINSGIGIINKEEVGFDKDGEERVVSTTKVPIKDAEGNIVGLIGIGRDLTFIKETESKLRLQTESLKEINTILEERQEEIRIQSEHIELERNQLRTLIDSMPDYIYFKDSEAKFITANKILVDVMKTQTLENLVGKTDYDFYPKEMADKFYEDDMEIIKSGKAIINKEEEGRDPEGNKLVMSTTKVPITDSDGKIMGLIGIGRDITEQKEAENELREQSDSLREINILLEEKQEEIKVQSEHIEVERNQLRTLIDSMPDVIYFKDEQARFVTANDTLIKVMQAGSLQNLKGKTDYDFYPKEMAEKFYIDDMEIIKSGEAIINKEEIGYNEEGEERYVSTTKVPLRDKDGRVFGLIGIGRDITKQKEAERKLIEQSEHLKEVNVLLEERQEEVQQQSEELAAQADNLREVNQELERLNVTKDKFFSIIAHDLKNPFHAIMGFSELLTKEFKDMDDNQKLGLIELINVSSESAFNLLENLLQWARTQTDKIKFNPVNLNIKDLVDQNFKLLKVSALKKKINLVTEVSVDTIAFADENMINTVVRNLISNAIKFTDPHGKITISVDETEHHYAINIADSGVGLDEETQQKLFRIDSYHTTTGTSGESGTGLGLIICKEFVLKNCGKISVKSKPGKGSTFTFTLPKRK